MGVRLLSQEVSSKIAAGEVIERPASIVKELLENSLDAGSTEITVQVWAGGIEHVRVSDNGSGISKDEVELAFQRFATSKLQTIGDLESISTLGFRGEALPSIAAVGAVELTTRTSDSTTGTRLTASNSVVDTVHSVGANPGTTVSVKQLFQNFPARKKFLRTPTTEASRIQKLLTRYALAFPYVRFRLKNHNGDVFVTSGSGDLLEVIASVYNAEYANQMLELVSEREPNPNETSTSGMIGAPSLTRANRSHISLFVNGRWVQDRTLTYALQEAYRGFLMEKRYPVAIINLNVPFESVDVNVHPSKTEVRFRHDGRMVFLALQQAARHTLMTNSPTPHLTQSPITRSSKDSTHSINTHSFWPTDHLKENIHSSNTTPHRLSKIDLGSDHDTTPNRTNDIRSTLPALRPLGQVQNTFIVAEGPDGLFLIDQHAAHERVLFERVTEQIRTGEKDVQTLLEPVSVMLDPIHAEIVDKNSDLLARSGFNVENFGDQTYLIRGIPALFSSAEPRQTFVEIIEIMANGGDFESWEDRAAYSIACHSAIRAGKTMKQSEIVELIQQLEGSHQPQSCPHGRPTMIHLPLSRLEREFRRK